MVSSFILAPLFLLTLLNLPFESFRKQLAFWLAGALFLNQLFLTAVHFWLPWSVYPDPLAPRLAFKLSVDGLALMALFSIALVALVALLVAKSTITTPRRKFHFINLLLIAVIGMNTTALATDIFSLYVFLEITAVAAFVLIALEKNKFAVEGTFKYLVLSVIASIFLLTSTAFFVLVPGDVSFKGIHDALSSGADSFWLTLAVGLFLCGLFIKCGVVPFHGWVPDAYSEAPAASSVLLAGIVTKGTGVYAMLRLFRSVFILKGSFQNVIMFIGAASIVLAALAAFRQNNIKRLLAYSSISQVGYIALAIGCGTPLAFLGAAWHFFNHAVFKSLLFVNAASLEKKFGSSDVAIITGLGDRLPVTSVTSLVGLLSAAGLPPFSGFWSKLIIIMALFSAGRPAYGSVALLAGVLTLAYFLLLERNVFFVRSEMPLEGGEKVPFGMRFAEVLLAAITLAVGLGFPFIFKTWRLI